MRSNDERKGMLKTMNRRKTKTRPKRNPTRKMRILKTITLKKNLSKTKKIKTKR